jgi:ABC-2 type transport system permease protein
MLAFAFRMLHDKLRSFIIYSLAAVGFLEMYVALFPAIRQQASQFDQMLKSFPPELFKAMNMDPSTLSFATLESYLSTEYMSFLWPILAIFFAVSLANYISVAEIDKGTIETLASLPASRSRIFVERYFAGLLILAGFCAISLFGVIPLAKMHSSEYILGNYLTASVGSFLFIWAVYSLASLSSVLFSERSRANMLSGGVLILMYVIQIISTLKESLSDLKYLSFFHYFNGSDLLVKNVYPEYMLLALGGFAVIAVLLSLVWFNRRDLSV